MVTPNPRPGERFQIAGAHEAPTRPLGEAPDDEQDACVDGLRAPGVRYPRGGFQPRTRDVSPPDVRPVRALQAEGWTCRSLGEAVASGTLVRVHRGVYAGALAVDPVARHLQWVAAIAPTRHEDAVVSHTSAAALHGLPVRAGALAKVHFTRWGSTQGKVTSSIHVHRAPLREDEVLSIGGLRVTSLERTIADVARCEPYEWGVITADAGLRRQASEALLGEEVERWKGCKGAAKLRRVVAFADPRAESPAESLSRVSIHRAGLPLPVLQLEVRDDDNQWIATGDFGWREPRILGEVDGRLKYAEDDRGRSASDVIMREKARDALIQECGWWPVHWDWGIAGDHVRLGALLRAAFNRSRR